jgi:hypothetical protein
MGSPAIFKGSRSGLLSSKGLLLKDGTTIDNDGVLNFIKNGHAEVDALGWATYADAAGAAPVDGTGGSANVTWARSTSSPLAGSGSFLFTKDAANRQGQGVSFDFTLDPAYRARVMNIKFDYIVGSGTFAAGTSSTDSDLTVWLYDVTNSTLIQPSSFRLLSNSSTIADTFQSTFQTSATGASYRLIVHCSTTSASAYSVKFDNVQVTPTEYAFGTPVTDWASDTITGSWTSNTTYSVKSRRVGDNKEFQVKISTSGAPTSASLTLNLPNTIDTAKLGDSTAYGQTIGTLEVFDSATTIYNGIILVASSTTVALYVGNASGTYLGISNLTQAAPITFGAGDTVVATFSVPILGWSSSVQTSDQTSTRVIAAKYTSATASLSSAFSKVTFSTKVIDDTNSYSSGTYTVSVAGKYKISATILVARSATVSGNIIQLATFKNGVGQNISLLRDQGTESQSRSIILNDILDCKAGDTIEIHGYAEGTSPTIPSDSQRNFLTIERISGPNQIAASETVAALYTGAPPTGTLNGSYNTVTYGTKVKDSHGAYSSGTYTVPVSGLYDISAQLTISATYSSTHASACAIYIDNVQQYIGAVRLTAAITTSVFASINQKSIPLLAGQLVTIRSQTDGTTPSFAAASTLNFFSITRSGNY